MYHQFNIQQLYVLPHTAVFMCFVWISEQTAIISLYNINWLVSVAETQAELTVHSVKCTNDIHNTIFLSNDVVKAEAHTFSAVCKHRALLSGELQACQEVTCL